MTQTVIMSDQPHLLKHLPEPVLWGRVKKHSLNALLTDLPLGALQNQMWGFFPGFPSQAGRAQAGGVGRSLGRDTAERQGGGRASGAAGASPGQRRLRPGCHLAGVGRPTGAASGEQPQPNNPTAAAPQQRSQPNSPTGAVSAKQPHRSALTAAPRPPPPPLRSPGAGRGVRGGPGRAAQPRDSRALYLSPPWRAGSLSSSSAPAVCPRSASTGASPSSPPDLRSHLHPSGYPPGRGWGSNCDVKK